MKNSNSLWLYAAGWAQRVATGFFAWVVIGTPALAQPAPAPEPERWGYLYAQCMQEAAQEPRNICEAAAGEEPVLAIIVSNIVRLDSKSFDPHVRFASELTRLHGLDMEPREVMPFSTWQKAEAALGDNLRLNRRIEKGEIAFLALSLEPERLADEPNAEELEQMPPPLPDVTAAYRDEALTVWRTDAACGLRDKAGKAVLPALVADPFGEAGEGCPFQVAPGYGLYAFHVERSGATCGAGGICTEFYGPDGNLMLVAEHSPAALTIHRNLQALGLLVTGARVQRLWSFPERRYVSPELPFINLGPDDRVLVGDPTIRHNRVAVPFERHRSPRAEAFVDTADEYALFFLDTRRFEDVVLADPGPIGSHHERPVFAQYEAAAIEPCVGDSAWLLGDDQRAGQYLRDSYFEFDKHFRVFTGRLARDLDAAEADRAAATRLATRLDAQMPRLARLLDGVAAPADSLAVARVAGSFEFQSPALPGPDDDHTAWLRAALARDMVRGDDYAAADLAGERIDGFLTALGRLRYGLRRLETPLDAARRAAEVTALQAEAQALVRDWRAGVRPLFETAIFDDSPRLAQRLHRHVRAICSEAGR